MILKVESFLTCDKRVNSIDKNSRLLMPKIYQLIIRNHLNIANIFYGIGFWWHYLDIFTLFTFYIQTFVYIFVVFITMFRLFSFPQMYIDLGNIQRILDWPIYLIFWGTLLSFYYPCPGTSSSYLESIATTPWLREILKLDDIGSGLTWWEICSARSAYPRHAVH